MIEFLFYGSAWLCGILGAAGFIFVACWIADMGEP